MHNSNDQAKQLAFASFCLEEYKTLHGIEGAKAVAFLARYGVLDYVMEHYEILHSFGRDAILDDMEQFIQNRRGRK